MAVILEADRVTKHYGALVAVNQVSLEVEEGTIHSIIGPNGAGKTTFFNLLSGVTPITSGRIAFAGEDITSRSLHQVATLGMGRSFQQTQLFPELSVIENVRLAAQSVNRQRLNAFVRPRQNDQNHTTARRILEAIGLAAQARKKAAILSHGEQRALDVGIALALDPKLLLLDEPTAGMSASEVHSMTELVTRLRKTFGVTILLVEHNMNVVMSISDLITVFHQGRVLVEGVPERIRSDEAVRAAYIGGRLDA